MAVKYQILVCLNKATKDERWSAMRPSGGAPYEFATLAEAEAAERLCYGHDHTFTRIVEVEE